MINNTNNNNYYYYNIINSCVYYIFCFQFRKYFGFLRPKIYISLNLTFILKIRGINSSKNDEKIKTIKL